ncbi:MAG: hypothetical protein V1681_07645 [Candidatus Neomarinimicrobiota bacterium]
MNGSIYKEPECSLVNLVSEWLKKVEDNTSPLRHSGHLDTLSRINEKNHKKPECFLLNLVPEWLNFPATERDL